MVSQSDPNQSAEGRSPCQVPNTKCQVLFFFFQRSKPSTPQGCWSVAYYAQRIHSELVHQRARLSSVLWDKKVHLRRHRVPWPTPGHPEPLRRALVSRTRVRDRLRSSVAIARHNCPDSLPIAQRCLFLRPPCRVPHPFAQAGFCFFS